jgi:hypothetical protein
MRKIMLAVAATSLAIPVMDAPAVARPHTYKGKVWQDSHGRWRCKRSNGTTGLLVGAAGGALVGRAIDTHGNVQPGRSSEPRPARCSVAALIETGSAVAEPHSLGGRPLPLTPPGRPSFL